MNTLTGIKIEKNAAGQTSRIIIDAKAKTELVEDLLDTIVVESRKGGKRISHDYLMTKLKKQGRLK